MSSAAKKKLIRSFSTTQLARRMAPGAGIAGCFGLLGFALTLHPLFAFTLFFVVLWIGILIARRPQQQLVAIARRLHETLRWFEAATTNRIDAEQLAALRDALPPQQTIVSVPCAAMQRIDDLATGLAAHFATMRWPEDPARKAAAMLAEGAVRGRRPLVVVLQDVDQLAARDADGHARFLAAWEQRMQQFAPPVLLFLHGAPRAQAAAPEAPTTEVVASAPGGADGAWWQRRPGELAD